MNTQNSLKMTDPQTASAEALKSAGATTANDNAVYSGGDAIRFHFPFEAIQHVSLAADAIIIFVAALVGGASYQLVANGTIGDLHGFAGAGAIAALLYCLIAQSAGHYRLTAITSSHGDLKRVVHQWLAVSLILALMAFLLKVGAEFSRGSIIFFAASALALLSVSRLVAKRLFSNAIAKKQLHGKRIVLMGTRNELAVIDEGILLRKFGSTEVGRVVLPAQNGSNLSMSEADASSIDRAIEDAREHGAEEIMLVMSWTETRRLELIRDRLRQSPLPVRLLPDRCIRFFSEHQSFSVGSSLAVEIQRGPLSRAEQFEKRLLDIIVASAALLIFSPLMLMTAAAIKLDSFGSVFFRQRRNGFNARQFLIFKFRTMTVAEDGVHILQATKFDKRVTRVGGLLRRSSIDELPQLLNVLKGEMSLVGPRPHALAHDNQYGKLLSEYAFRHHMKPGITGWAQVNGFRGETSHIDQMRQRVDFDIWYINHWSIWLDLRILLKTGLEVSRSRNAY